MRIRFARKLLKNSMKKFSNHIIVGITVTYLYLKAKYVIISWTVQTDRMKTGIHGLKRIRPIWKISDQLAVCGSLDVDETLASCERGAVATSGCCLTYIIASSLDHYDLAGFHDGQNIVKPFYRLPKTGFGIFFLNEFQK